MNDPFKNFKPLNTFNSKSTKKSSKAPAGDSFVEQIKSIGASAVDSVKTDVVKGTAKSIFDQIMGSAQTGQVPDQAENPDLFRELMEQHDKEVAEEAKSEERAFQNHRHNQENVLFSFADEKLSRELSETRQELKVLMETVDQVDKQIEQAAMQEVIDPGLYHLNFFRNLKNLVIFWRKSLESASLWMQTQQSRGKKSYFWNQVAKSGTKYSMSSERNVVMGAG